MRGKTEPFDVNGVKFIHHKKRLYCLEPVFLDIETSNNHADDPKDLITWITSIQVLFNNQYYLFRTPEELIDFYLWLYVELGLFTDPNSLEPRLITFIHNASYDLSYLTPYFIHYLPGYDNKSQGIIEGVNKFLSYQQGCFEWRCSYRLCNMSLAKWSNEMRIKHKKLMGLYDYDKVIYPDDVLTENEQAYDKNDVLAMAECLTEWNNYHGDDLSTMPLTFTGYVRRELRKSCKSNKKYRKKYFIDNRLDAEIYYTYLKSYAGGMTHNNRFYKGMTLVSGKSYRYMNKEIYVPIIGHRDFKSHYPTQMTCYPFPVGKPSLLYDVNFFDNPILIDDILSYYPKFSAMSVIRIYEAEIKDKSISMPFLQFSKCYNGSFDKKRLDNGRIIYARGEWIMYFDNLTLKIITEQYNLKYEVLKVWISKNEFLPPEIVNIIDKYFKGKSDKKSIVHDLTKLKGKLDPETVSAQFDLSQTKISLNSIYGCTATNPLRYNYAIDYNMEFRITDDYITMADIQAGLDKFYKGKNNFLSYAIGCTVTALARYELYEFIKAIGYDKCIYCDTDSIFYIKDTDTEKAIEELNRRKRETAHSVKLENGKIEFYDEFTSEPDCIAFRGLHAKCYGVVNDKGLELTIAGVPARTLTGLDDKGEPIYLTREAELQGKTKDPIKALDKLDNEFTFRTNVGASAIYIGATGNNTPRVPTIVDVNGHTVSTAGGCVIRRLDSKKVHDTDYDLNSYEYTDIPLFE